MAADPSERTMAQQVGPGRPGVIVDRDATLIDVVRDEETGTISVAFHPSQIRFLPGVVHGLQAFSQAGYALCIATNQPGPAKGQFSAAAVQRTNQALVERLAERGVRIAAVEVCMHHPDGGPGGDPALVGPCDCRKPQPGMLLRAIDRLGLDPAASWMIGDSAVDVGAARAAGIRSGLVFPLDRCELCPLRWGPQAASTLHAPRFDLVARAVLAADQRGAGPHQQ